MLAYVDQIVAVRSRTFVIVPIQGFNKHEHQAASPENCLITPNQQLYSNDTLEKFRRLAQDIFWLMNTKLSAKEPDWFRRQQPLVWYRSLWYGTLESWSQFRRVVSKVEYAREGFNIRFVVTSVSAKKVSPSRLYTQHYCPRGEMENRFLRTANRTFQRLNNAYRHKATKHA